MSTDELTPEELALKGHEEWSHTIQPNQRGGSAGDPVLCPRCQRRWIAPQALHPCQTCQIKVLKVEIARMVRIVEAAKKWKREGVAGLSCRMCTHRHIAGALCELCKMLDEREDPVGRVEEKR